MVCPACGTDNRSGRKFCAECGSQLAVDCQICGSPNEPGEKFCGQCGRSLGDQTNSTLRGTAAIDSRHGPPAPLVPAAERRLVSVLFADLVGFTALSQYRDPEDVRDLLSRYFDRARELIARYGGTVEKFIGDAVMAVWGTPAAHEDDAERAVRAALELVDQVAALGKEVGLEELRARAGVLTGEAAVTIGAEGQGMVAGDMVNTASRLQSAAEPGTVLVGQATYLAANKAIAFSEESTYHLKGKDEPITAWRALRIVAGTGGQRRTETLEAPFVGRHEELRLIKDLFHTTARERRPHLVSVMGIGGIGKSRLAWELFKYVDGLAETVYWHSGRCPAYGEGVTFWAVAEMVRMRARIAETEDPGSVRSKLASTVEGVVSDPEEREWVEPALSHLLGLEENPPGEREELFAAWRTFFERVADQGPTVIVVEDLQWADSGTIDFVESVLEWSRQSPILLLTLSRPELAERRSTWGAGQRNFISIHLDPLRPEEMRELLAGLAPGLPLAVVQQVLERAEGVPLYAVETVRMLVDQHKLTREDGAFVLAGPLERLEVPGSLHALIASRMDALDPIDRAVLQDASVAGKTFTLDALSAVTGRPAEALKPCLKELVRKELLVLDRDPRSPERGQYGFVQSLIKEVAYQTLSKRDRRTRHLAAARYFESLEDPELAGVMASHYIEAYRATTEGPEAEALATQARGSLLAAAERAGALGSHDQALAYIEVAMTVTTDPAESAELWERAAEAARRGAAFESARDYLQRAIPAYQAQGQLSSAARATAWLGGVLMEMSQLEPAIETLESALAELGDLDSDPEVVSLMAELARGYMFKLDPRRSIEWADRALDAAERLDEISLIAEALITKGVASQYVGRFRESIALLSGALALAREDGLTRQQLRAQINLGLELGLVDPAAAVSIAKEGIGLARKLGLRALEIILSGNGAFSALSTGEWDWVEATLTELAASGLSPILLTAIEAPLSVLRAFRGAKLEAENRLASLRPEVEASTSPQDQASLLLSESLVALAGNRLAEAYERGMAAAEADASLALASFAAARAGLWMGDVDRAAQALVKLEAETLHGRWVELARRTIRAGIETLAGRQGGGVALYREAQQGWRDLEVPFDLAMCHLDFMTLAGLDMIEVQGAAAEAREIFARLGAGPFIDRLERVKGIGP